MFARKLLTHINQHFSHDELLSTFSMIDIEAAIIKSKEGQILKYGNEHLFKLEEQLGIAKKNHLRQYYKH